MDTSDTLDEATGRLNAVIDAFVVGLARLEEEARMGVATRSELATLAGEHERLGADIDVERGRVRRLKSANDEVSERLGSVIDSIRSALDAS